MRCFFIIFAFIICSALFVDYSSCSKKSESHESLITNKIYLSSSWNGGKLFSPPVHHGPFSNLSIGFTRALKSDGITIVRHSWIAAIRSNLQMTLIYNAEYPTEPPRSIPGQVAFCQHRAAQIIRQEESKGFTIMPCTVNEIIMKANQIELSSKRDSKSYFSQNTSLSARADTNIPVLKQVFETGEVLYYDHKEEKLFYVDNGQSFWLHSNERIITKTGFPLKPLFLYEREIINRETRQIIGHTYDLCESKLKEDKRLCVTLKRNAKKSSPVQADYTLDLSDNGKTILINIFNDAHFVETETRQLRGSSESASGTVCTLVQFWSNETALMLDQPIRMFNFIKTKSKIYVVNAYNGERIKIGEIGKHPAFIKGTVKLARDKVRTDLAVLAGLDIHGNLYFGQLEVEYTLAGFQ